MAVSNRIYGERAPRVTSQALPYTLVVGDYGNVVRTTNSGNVTLPSPAVVGDGWWCIVKEGADVATSMLVRSASENIDTSASDYGLSKLEGVRVTCDGTDWWLT